MDNHSVMFQALLALHLVGLALGLGGAFVADWSFFKTLRRADRITPDEVNWMRSFSQVVWIGLIVLTASGIGIFLTDTEKYLHSTGFLFKMLLVVILVINGLFLNFYSTSRLTTFNFSEKYQHKDAAWRARKLSFVFGAVSATTWYSILFVAMMKSKLNIPFFGYLGAYLLVLGGAIGSSMVLERYLFSRAVHKEISKDIKEVPISELAENPELYLAQIRDSKAKH